jgi:uncharacterized repeat protein (TIGR03803 family)
LRPWKLSKSFVPVVALVLSICSLSAVTVAQSHGRVLYAFATCGLPDTPLVADALGNLYGGTSGGGAGGQGCIFELSPTEYGWQETMLYGFSGPDGNGPYGALIFDKLGNLYGTTVTGGAFDAGVVFELSPSTGGAWTETILHNFGSTGDGTAPESNLIFDGQGNLYGTTNGGGTRTRNGGTVFKLTPGGDGWTETILYSFPGSINGPDADGPKGGVVMSPKGKLYGDTLAGGRYGVGAVFELDPSGGAYREKVIYSFSGTDGLEPISGLTMDRSGIIYGSTCSGNPHGWGNIFRLAEDADGVWNETNLHDMNSNDGICPVGPVVFDAAGNLYAAAERGAINAMGSVFMLTPTQSGYWTETVLHRFDFKFPNGVDGEQPYAGVILNRGKVFGTTAMGGVNDSGVVFEITPGP